MKQGVAPGVGVATAAGDTTANLITVGANSTVNLGTNAAGLSTDGGSTVTVATDTAGTALTNHVTINHDAAGSSKAIFFTTGAENPGTAVNVATATTLAQAMNLAVTVATNGGVAANNYYAAFNGTDGNTYVIGHAGAAETALSANDIVIELTGLVTPTLTVATHSVLL